jgi:hypothetical protein
MKIKSVKEDYLEKAKELSEAETERLASRISGKLNRRLDDKKLNITEAIAIQLEYEDKQLAEWRENRIKMKEKHK